MGRILAKSAFGVAGIILFFAFSNCGKPFQSAQDSNSDAGGLSVTNPPPGTPPGNPPATPDFSLIAGIYNKGTAHQVVLPSGEYWAWNGYGILQFGMGAITYASGQYFAGQMTSGNYIPGPISGTYSPGTDFNGGTYSPTSKTPALLSTLVAQWWGNLQDGDTPYLTFDPNGGISGTSANQHCTFSGRLQPHPSGMNLYSADITRANCLGSGKSESFVGIAVVSGSAIHVLAINAAKTLTLAWEGYRL